MRPHVDIRNSCLGDVPAVKALADNWKSEDITYSYTPPSANRLEKQLGPYFWVAEYENAIIGYAKGSEEVNDRLAILPVGTKYLEIESIYVVPEWRGKSIGTKLLNALTDQAKTNGVDKFLLYALNKDSDGLIRFYRRHGFSIWSVEMIKQ